MAMGSLATWPVKLIDSFVFFQEAMFFPRHLFTIGLIGFQALDLLTQDCIILLKFSVFLLDRGKLILAMAVIQVTAARCKQYPGHQKQQYNTRQRPETTARILLLAKARL